MGRDGTILSDHRQEGNVEAPSAIPSSDDLQHREYGVAALVLNVTPNLVC